MAKYKTDRGQHHMNHSFDSIPVLTERCDVFEHTQPIDNGSRPRPFADWRWTGSTWVEGYRQWLTDYKFVRWEQPNPELYDDAQYFRGRRIEYEPGDFWSNGT